MYLYALETVWFDSVYSVFISITVAAFIRLVCPCILIPGVCHSPGTNVIAAGNWMIIGHLGKSEQPRDIGSYRVLIICNGI